MKTLLIALSLTLLSASSSWASENEAKVTKHRSSFGGRYIFSNVGAWAIHGESATYIKESPFYFSGEFIVGSTVMTYTAPFVTALLKIGVDQVKDHFTYGADLGLGVGFSSAYYPSQVLFAQQVKTYGGYILGDGWRVNLDAGYLNISQLSPFSGFFAGLSVTRKFEISIKGLDD